MVDDGYLIGYEDGNGDFVEVGRFNNFDESVSGPILLKHANSGETLEIDASGFDFTGPVLAPSATIDGNSSPFATDPHGDAAHTPEYVNDGDDIKRQVFVIANGASDPAGANAEDLIFEEEG